MYSYQMITNVKQWIRQEYSRRGGNGLNGLDEEKNK